MTTATGIRDGLYLVQGGKMNGYPECHRLYGVLDGHIVRWTNHVPLDERQHHTYEPASATEEYAIRRADCPKGQSPKTKTRRDVRVWRRADGDGRIDVCRWAGADSVEDIRRQATASASSLGCPCLPLVVGK